jgi:hypothetical protein
MKDTVTINREYLILCEGKRDKVVLETLLEGQLNGTYQVVPLDQLNETGGNSRWSHALLGLLGITGISKVSGLVVIADSEDNPDQSFRQVHDAFANLASDPEESNQRFSIPHEPQRIYVDTDRVPVGVWMVPAPNRLGSMETLVVEGSLEVAPDSIRTCVQEFIDCSNLDAMTESNKDKCRVRALLIAYGKCETSFSRIWRECSEQFSLAGLGPIKTFLESLVADTRG